MTNTNTNTNDGQQLDLAITHDIAMDRVAQQYSLFEIRDFYLEYADIVYGCDVKYHTTAV